MSQALFSHRNFHKHSFLTGTSVSLIVANSTSTISSRSRWSDALEKTHSEADLIRKGEVQNILYLTAKYKNLIEMYWGERRENTQGSETLTPTVLLFNTEILLDRGTNLTPLATDFAKSKCLMEKIKMTFVVSDEKVLTGLT